MTCISSGCFRYVLPHQNLNCFLLHLDFKKSLAVRQQTTAPGTKRRWNIDEVVPTIFLLSFSKLSSCAPRHRLCGCARVRACVCVCVCVCVCIHPDLGETAVQPSGARVSAHCTALKCCRLPRTLCGAAYSDCCKGWLAGFHLSVRLHVDTHVSRCGQRCKATPGAGIETIVFFTAANCPAKLTQFTF